MALADIQALDKQWQESDDILPIQETVLSNKSAEALMALVKKRLG